MSQAPQPVEAAVLLIGDELLSGRTQDANLRALAEFLGPLGVQVREARTVPDLESEIAAALNALRARFSYVFTTGGIGPTHDDKTADAVALAFGLPVEFNAAARAVLLGQYGEALNETRLRMARMPIGAIPIANPVSKAPGFQIGNVFVLAGVPSIMRGMLEDVAPRLHGGAVVEQRTLRRPGLREGDIGAALGELQARFPEVALGSYPWFDADGCGVNLVARSSDPARLEEAAAALEQLSAPPAPGG
ncbi:MAG: competence/damage-inducible protein A [Hyphomonadaceae bacterium]|nr:competence/damage-inducible protein A [Hyphomonadaceae bacterium]